MIKTDYPNAEYGISINILDSEDIKEALAQHFRTTKENVELSNYIKATVRTIVKYEDQNK